MKARLLLLFLFVAVTQFIHAQPSVVWQKCYGGTGEELGYSSERLPDGGFLLAGYAASNNGDVSGNHGGTDGWVVRTDSLGALLSQKCYGGSNEEYFRSVMQTSDGGFIAFGHTESNNGDVTGNHGASDYWLVKADASGAIQWQKCYGGTADDIGYCAVQTSDGGYIMTGNSTSNDGDVSGNHGGADYWVVKTDAAGTIEWQKCYGGSNTDWGYRIREIATGYVMTGIGFGFTGDLAGAGSNGGEEYFAIITDFTGTIVHKKCFGGSSWDDGYNIVPTSDGGYVLIGISASSNGMNVGGNGYPGDAWFVKTDGQLNMEWQRSLGGTEGERGFDMVETDDGGFIVGCYTKSNDLDVNGLHPPIGSSFATIDLWLAKINYAGSLQWQKCLGGSKDEFSFEFKDMLHLLPNGDLYVFASTKSNDGDVSGNHGISSNDFWLVKLHDSSNKIEGTLYFDWNANLALDTTDQGVGNTAVLEATTGNVTFTNEDGTYSMIVPDSGNYSVQPVSIPYYTFSPASQPAHFSLQANQTEAGNDFGFTPSGTANDLRVTVSPLSGYRKGFVAGFLIGYKNVGTDTLSGTVSFNTVDPLNASQYVSASVIPDFSSNDSLAWSFSDLAPYQSGSVMLYVQVSPLINTGTLVHSFAHIAPAGGDATPSDNTFEWVSEVVAACDPNEILVNIDTIYDAQIANPPSLEYYIRFQNTGNDTAVNVRIVDIIPQQLVPASIELLASSHPVQMNYEAMTQELVFVFDNIMLPDSNVNEPQSHGAVSFRVNVIPGLVPGTDIDNYVDIYFDFNNAVTTNTATTHIELINGIGNVGITGFDLFPNPAKNQLTIQRKTGDQNALVELRDATGRLLLRKQLADKTSVLSLEGVAPGIYSVSLLVENRSVDTRKIAIVR